MLTLQQAQALQPGDEIYQIYSGNDSVRYLIWKVYSPMEWESWPDDDSIVQYIVSDTGIKSYLFRTHLHVFFV